MTMKESIKKAIEGGFEKAGWNSLQDRPALYDLNERLAEHFLDPSFWQFLGKILGWDESTFDERVDEYAERNWKLKALMRDCGGYDGLNDNLKALVIKEVGEGTKGWLYHWHSFIDTLAAGHDASSFFENLN